MLFAWRICRHVRSNAIVIAAGGATDRHRRRSDEPGRRGADRGREGATFRPDLLAGSALASDAFFPFADGPAASRSRPASSAIIQPGGSVRDEEVVAPPTRRGSRWSRPIAVTSATSTGGHGAPMGLPQRGDLTEPR